MSLEARFYWNAPIDLLDGLEAVFDLPASHRPSEPREVSLILEPPLQDGTARLTPSIHSIQELRTILLRQWASMQQVQSLWTESPMLAYLNLPEHPTFFYPARVCGGLSFSRHELLATWNAEFPEAFYPDHPPGRPMAPEVLATYRREYLPLTQAFWLAQVCTLLRRLRPAAMVATRPLRSLREQEMWTGHGLECRIPLAQFVLVYVQGNLPVSGLPASMREIRYSAGSLLWAPDVLRCDVAAVAERVQAPGYDPDQEWQPYYRAWANGRPWPAST